MTQAIDLEPILAQVKAGDPVGAAYRLTRAAGTAGPGRLFYEAGSVALEQRDDLGDDALRFARLVFAEAVEREPELAEAHHDLATTMRELGMADDAVREYQRALELLPDDLDSLIGMGAAHADAGRVDEALEALRRATDAHPQSGRAQANFGIILEAAGDDAGAVGAYARAVARFEAALTESDDDDETAELIAQRRWARIQHAELLERLEHWAQAVAVYRQLIEEERLIAEAMEEAEAEDEAEAAAEAGAGGARRVTADTPTADGGADVAGPPVEHAAGGKQAHAHGHEDGGEDEDEGEGGDGDGDSGLEEEEEAGRLGLERLFSRLVGLGELALAFLVLDEIGGELADRRTRATYTIYDPGDGVPVIMAEHWDDGRRERLIPQARK